MAIYRKAIETEFGRFVFEANEVGLSRVIFPPQAARYQDTPSTSAILQEAVQQFQNYFSGKAYDFSELSYDFSEMTDFQEKILRTLLNAPKKTIAYSELAEMSGYPKSSRAVGSAMNKNPFPILIPCHRVIQASGEMGNYAYGMAWKKRLLNHEALVCS